MQKLINQLVPFILVGVAVVAFAFGIVIMVYLFVFGAIVGLGLFMLNWLRYRFFPPKTVMAPKKEAKSGRIIDSDDWRKM